MPTTCENRPAGGALVASHIVLECFEALRRAGKDARAVARAVGISLSDVEQGSAVPAAALRRMFAETEKASGDPLIGLHVAEHAAPRGVLAHLLMSSSSLEEGLLRCRRFGPVVVSTARIRVEKRLGHYEFEYEFGDDDLDTCPHVADYALMGTTRTISQALGRDVTLLEVHFRHGDSGRRTEFERAFRCPARFGMGHNCLLIPDSSVQHTPRMANTLIADQIEKFAEALLPPEQPEPRSFTQTVATTTRALLGAGVRAERKLVGKRLGVSERTLHRRLAEEGSSFRDVREDVLWELAEALVSDSDLKLEAVAESVGFSDAAAFSKAFKRRAGCSPLTYRRTAAGARVIARRESFGYRFAPASLSSALVIASLEPR